MTATTSSQVVALGAEVAQDSTEKPVPSWQAASAAAIFIGCCSNISLRLRWPVSATPAKDDHGDDGADAQGLDPDTVVDPVAALPCRGLADDDAALASTVSMPARRR